MRVAFVTTRSGRALAEDLTFSAGATAILTTPITLQTSMMHGLP